MEFVVIPPSFFYLGDCISAALFKSLNCLFSLLPAALLDSCLQQLKVYRQKVLTA